MLACMWFMNFISMLYVQYLQFASMYDVCTMYPCISNILSKLNSNFCQYGSSTTSRVALDVSWPIIT